jgi:hypothetical protein
VRLVSIFLVNLLLTVISKTLSVKSVLARWRQLKTVKYIKAYLYSFSDETGAEVSPIGYILNKKVVTTKQKRKLTTDSLANLLSV